MIQSDINKTNLNTEKIELNLNPDAELMNTLPLKVGHSIKFYAMATFYSAAVLSTVVAVTVVMTKKNDNGNGL